MKPSRTRSIATAGAVLGLIAASGRAVSASCPPPQGQRQVAVAITVEWVNPSPAPSVSLTLVVTQDQTGTVTLLPAPPSQQGESVTARPHVNPDGSITVRLTAERAGAADAPEFISGVRTLKPGQPLAWVGLTNGAGGGARLLVTASLVRPGADPLSDVPAGPDATKVNGVGGGGVGVNDVPLSVYPGRAATPSGQAVTP